MRIAMPVVGCWQCASYFLATLLFAANMSCGPRIRNVALDAYDPEGGYRFESLETGENNTDSVFVYLAFSGGGTRAAAFSYGVLVGLRDTTILSSDGSVEKRLIDEVDVISSVSGGSFTAMGYGLWRDKLFDGQFEKSFLRHNVQGDLLRRALNPINWFAHPDSGEMAAKYYGEKIFKHSTYADLMKHGQRPFVVVNAADVARTEQFQFTQDSFDLMGSDLAELPVSWSVASSSAFPILLDPLRFKYYPGEAMTSAIQQTLRATTWLHPARYNWARSLIDLAAYVDSSEVQIDEDNHRYLYLADGGLVDNLGMYFFFQGYNKGIIRQKMEAGEIDHLILIIVDAGTDSHSNVERSAATPGKLSVGFTAANAGVYTTTWLEKVISKYVLVELQQRQKREYEELESAARRQCPEASLPDRPVDTTVEHYVVDLNFHEFPDEQMRERYLSMPTNFALQADEVDDLIQAGRTLVAQNPQLQRLLRNLRK